MDGDDTTAITSRWTKGEVFTLPQFEALGESNKEEQHPKVVDLELDDLITIVYTSGTSGGRPKGVMLPDSWLNRYKLFSSPLHSSFFFVLLFFLMTPHIYILHLWIRFINNPWPYDPLAVLSFMPLTHNTGRMFLYTTLANGGRLALHVQPNMMTLFDEFKLINPTILVSAPRLYDMVYREYEAELNNDKYCNSLTSRQTTKLQASLMIRSSIQTMQ